MESNDTNASPGTESFGQGLLKLVFATSAGFVATAVANHTFEAIVKRRQNKTTTN